MSTGGVPGTSHDFTVRRVLSAPIEEAWAAWEDPEMVAAWWGPHGFTAAVHGLTSARVVRLWYR